MSAVRAERSRRLTTLRGANYLPTWSRSSYDAWGPRLDARQLDQELGQARRLGLNAIRVWVAREDETALPELLGNLRLLFDTAQRHGLGVVPVLFDSCGCQPDPSASLVPVGGAAELAAADPRWQMMLAWAGDRDLVGPHELIEVPWAGDPMGVIWSSWRPFPPYQDLLEAGRRAHHLAYVEAVAELAAAHEAVLAVELMNEPFLSPEWDGLDVSPIRSLYQDACAVVRQVAPDLPLGIGAANAADAAVHDANLGGAADLISLHCYGGADELRSEIHAARQLAGDRPVVLSEWGCFPGLPDERHEQVYRERLEALQDLDVGWFAFHLIAGYGPFALSSLLYPNGAMRPAAALLQEMGRATPR